MSETFEEVQEGLLESLERLLGEAREARDLRAQVADLKAIMEQVSVDKEVERLKKIAEDERSYSKAAREAREAWEERALAAERKLSTLGVRREDIRRAAVAAQTSLQILVSELTV